MIGRFWEEIFKYADYLKDRGEMEKLAAVKVIEDRLVKVWDEKEAFRKRIEKTPEDRIEEMVLSIPGIGVYIDPGDKQIFYEMDGRHFDKPEEVIKALIEYRQAGRKKAMTHTKIEIFRHMHESLKALGLSDLDDEKPKAVTTKERTEGGGAE